jgi:hypothetical protein
MWLPSNEGFPKLIEQGLLQGVDDKGHVMLDAIASSSNAELERGQPDLMGVVLLARALVFWRVGGADAGDQTSKGNAGG